MHVAQKPNPMSLWLSLISEANAPLPFPADFNINRITIRSVMICIFFSFFKNLHHQLIWCCCLSGSSQLFFVSRFACIADILDMSSLGPMFKLMATNWLTWEGNFITTVGLGSLDAMTEGFLPGATFTCGQKLHKPIKWTVNYIELGFLNLDGNVMQFKPVFKGGIWYSVKIVLLFTLNNPFEIRVGHDIKLCPPL